MPFAPFAPFAEFGVVPFDAAAGGASFAAGPPSVLAVAALAESMAALAFVCSKSVCLWWVPSAQSVSRVRRPHSPTLRFVRLLVGGDQGRVCSRVSSSVRPSRKNKNRDDEKNVGIFGPKGPKAFHFYSLSLSTLTSLGSARPETLSPFPLNPAALLEAKAGFSLTQLTSPSARPPPITVPTQKKK